MINEQEHLLVAAGKNVHLTMAEFKIMKLLIKNAGTVLNYNRLLKECRGINFDPSSNTVAVHVCNIKRKLKSHGLDNYLINVYGVGYRLQLPAPLSSV